MKYKLHNIETKEELVQFLFLSLKYVYKYPLETLDSVLYTTKGSWDINDISCTQIYGKGLNERTGYMLTNVEPGFGIIPDSKLPWLERLYEEAFSANKYQNIPLVSVLFAPALYFWIFLFCFVGFFYNKSYNYLFLSGFLLFLFLTILLGPCILVRYMYPFIICSPLLICMLKNSFMPKT